MMPDKDKIIAALKTVYDPEIPVNIWDLGLIYDVAVADNAVHIKMTFTSPTCPMMEELTQQIRDVVAAAADGAAVDVELVWDPPWNLGMMSDAARLELDLTEQGW